ncbi:MAG TPA: acyl-protein synthetase [Polyangiales bacterium]|nr:acyl-protein synthetase [Polyangiales bacterium]
MTHPLALPARIAEFIERCADGSRDDATRDALLDELLAWQATNVSAYGHFLSNERRRPHSFSLPALPTDAFRFARVASHAPQQSVRVFRTSGTTGTARGQHSFADLSLYDRAAGAAARYALFPDRPRLRLIILAPDETELPDSSLSYMLARFKPWFGTERSCYVWRRGQLQSNRLIAELMDAEASREPLALLGTSFAFVHAEDALRSQFELPAGSRIMQTGGFKGRSRSIEPDAMLAMLKARYGVPESNIVQEYGMTELSSQCYETTLRASVLEQNTITPRRLWVPGWVRVRTIDPDTLGALPNGQVGLLRIDDLANVGSVCAIQTSDLARIDSHGLTVLGRAPDSVARGCSIAVDAWLGG